MMTLTMNKQNWHACCLNKRATFISYDLFMPKCDYDGDDDEEEEMEEAKLAWIMVVPIWVMLSSPSAADDGFFLRQ